MKKKLLFVFFICSLRISAQIPKDSAYLQVTYLEDYSTRIEKPKLKSFDEMVLNIGKTSSMFYSKYESRRKNMMDSVLSHGGSPFDWQELTLELPRGQCYIVYKNYPQQDFITFIDKVCVDYYCYNEQKTSISWVLLDEKKEIKGYNCQKARANFRGREWTVWYTTEIPVSDGPWKLCGLAGLILEAKDSDELYSFHCVGIKQLENKLPIELLKSEIIKCSRTDYYRSAKEYIEDPKSFLGKIHGLGTVRAYSSEGKPLPFPTRTYFDMEKYE